MDIPLKDFNNYLDEHQKIDYLSLLNYGKENAEKKLKDIQSNLNFIESVKQEVSIKKKCQESKHHQLLFLPQKFFYVKPYTSELDITRFYTNLGTQIEEVSNKGYGPLPEWGRAHEYLPGEIKRYIFIEIAPTENLNENIKIIPSGDYLHTFVQGSQIENVPALFPELINNKNQVWSIETEAFISDYQEDALTNKLRILLKEK